MREDKINFSIDILKRNNYLNNYLILVSQEDIVYWKQRLQDESVEYYDFSDFGADELEDLSLSRIWRISKMNGKKYILLTFPLEKNKYFMKIFDEKIEEKFNFIFDDFYFFSFNARRKIEKFPSIEKVFYLSQEAKNPVKDFYKIDKISCKKYTRFYNFLYRDIDEINIIGNILHKKHYDENLIKTFRSIREENCFENTILKEKGMLSKRGKCSICFSEDKKVEFFLVCCSEKFQRKICRECREELKKIPCDICLEKGIVVSVKDVKKDYKNIRKFKRTGNQYKDKKDLKDFLVLNKNFLSVNMAINKIIDSYREKNKKIIIFSEKHINFSKSECIYFSIDIYRKMKNNTDNTDTQIVFFRMNDVFHGIDPSDISVVIFLGSNSKRDICKKLEQVNHNKNYSNDVFAIA